MIDPERAKVIYHDAIMFMQGSSASLPMVAIHLGHKKSRKFAIVCESGFGSENFVAIGSDVSRIVSAAIESWINHRIRFRKDVFSNSIKLRHSFFQILLRMVEQQTVDYPLSCLARFHYRPNLSGEFWQVNLKPINNPFPEMIWVGCAPNAVDAFMGVWKDMILQFAIFGPHELDSPGGPDEPELTDFAAADGQDFSL